MIVFTATHTVSGAVFVGNAREDLNQYWAELISLADGGAVGTFFNLLRETGAASFALDEFGFAENPAESRELIQEARDELGASVIKIPKGATTGAVRTRSVTAASEVKALLSGIFDEFAGGDDDFEALDASSNSSSKSTSNSTSNRNDSAESDRRGLNSSAASSASNKVAGVGFSKPSTLSGARQVSARSQSQNTAPEATGKASSAAKERRIKEAIAQQREERESAKRRAETQDAKMMRDVMLKIEKQRLNNKETAKSARLAEAKRLKQAESEAKKRAKKEEALSNPNIGPSSMEAPKKRVLSLSKKSKASPTNARQAETYLAQGEPEPPQPDTSAMSPKEVRRLRAQAQREEIRQLLALIHARKMMKVKPAANR
ncbi:hypothetical protein [Marinibactrum halimedae]|uniref:Uncharacterized protein n=1 Tax=Marinibactrum halimedae TaxID=1444977 RepID=A0AA37WNT7_9GAMM|nr:hypothetical protein [Marinibactrum halimedae]MCD9459908.1 hypothetical protein [Marinibactrum halimedae]GLS25237.1 hypothetical protein GCM10007877_09510 [Marinibactrum halimedae]